ncbi:homoserine kinase type II [Microbacterium barkeri]|uniref:Homoserine kinase type II n=1 Tax=Microbacterium barkeri TaxID=33917 RepID=A0A9W6LXX1_9MICO|nr:phosphotransferase [Microbacterium barkeri]MDR6877244.1 Ser/Thr protein kinase RdoA (MazF antagonist) [Microbacterium barkeri]GLJ62665.1 homoserine kinase type II [Microbacterium barkeri]
MTLPAGLSMLWEQTSPDAALLERFGFTGLPDASEWLSVTLREVWGIDLHGVGRLVISDRNAIVWVRSGSGPLVVKWSCATEQFDRLAASAEILSSLAARGVPVAEPILTTERRARAVQDGPRGPLSMAVLPEVSGVWLDTADLDAVHAAGQCLARLHDALGRESGDSALQMDVGDPRARIRTWLARHDRREVPEASSRLEALLVDLPDLEDTPQLVHNDFRAANILTRGSTVAAVLDFDEVATSHRVNDLARASVYLRTRFTDWRPTSVATRESLRRGYESVRALGEAERAWLEALILWHGLMAIPFGSDPSEWAASLR